MLAIDLNRETEVRLEEVARANGRSAEEYARETLLEHLEDLEDIRIADQRMDALERGETRPVSLDQVMKKYDL